MTDLKTLVDLIKQKKKVTFFQGAGISTGAGIPDFRSPKTGLYSNLKKLNLPYAEAVFDIDYFRKNPKAFYTLAEELYPGKFNPTDFHYFIRILQDKGLLQRVYTQNIDTLERIAGVKDEFIIEAHGSFSANHCIECKHEMTISEIKRIMGDKKIPRCGKCKGLVKPDIVFFGEALPVKLFDTWEKDCDEVEIGIVAGTSLTVYPFASLPSELGQNVTRVLVNNEKVGDFDDDDLIFIDNCDSFARKVCRELGWEDLLSSLKKSGKVELGEEIEKITEEMKHVLSDVPSEKGNTKQEDKVEDKVGDKVRQVDKVADPTKPDTNKQEESESKSEVKEPSLLDKLKNLSL